MALVSSLAVLSPPQMELHLALPATIDAESICLERDGEDEESERRKVHDEIGLER